MNKMNWMRESLMRAIEMHMWTDRLLAPIEGASIGDFNLGLSTFPD